MSEKTPRTPAWHWWAAAAGTFVLSHVMFWAACVGGILFGPEGKGDLWSNTWWVLLVLSQFIEVASVFWIMVLLVLTACRFVARWISGHNRPVP